jgi:flagellar hook assembly protein FlgD
VVYFAIGFEQIADEADRDTLMSRIIKWFEEGTTGIEVDHQVVETFQLQQNYPNPFNPETIIKYSLPLNGQAEIVSLVVYNQLGEKVKTLVNDAQPSGNYEVTWNGTDELGNKVASGVYYYRLRYGDIKQSRKMLLLQ